MFTPLPLYIGLRYTRAKRRNHFISFISLSSMLGIALGITALITVLSVMNGFEKELRHRMLGMAAHVTVISSSGYMLDWREQIEALKNFPRVTGAAPFVQGQGMATSSQRVQGLLLQGIDPVYESRISQVQEKMKVGSLDTLVADSFNVIIGIELANSLGVGVGDKMTVVVPQATVTPVGLLPRMKQMTVTGIFEVGMHEFDSAFALLHVTDAAKLLRMPEGSVEGIHLKVDDMFAAPMVSNALRVELPMDYRTYDWTYRHANFFRAIKMEKTVMFVILTLIVAVAAFNIVSTLVMVVTDKEADIAILRTLGATPLTIMWIFIVQGTLIGLFGTLLGLIGGVSLALNVETVVAGIEHFFNTKFLNPEVYYISELPSDLQWFDVYRISLTSFIISLLATIYPAWRAARTQPAEALRYE